jgi:hypothetical protein
MKRSRSPATLLGGRVERVREADPDGRIVVHHRTVDTLARMLKAGTIDQAMHDAGRDFEAAFVLASLDRLRAASMLHVPAAGTGSAPELSERQLDARRRVHHAIATLGGQDSPGGSCLWFVLGHQMSLRQWALRQRWGGRAVRPDEATGVLMAALATLAARRGHRSRNE